MPTLAMDENELIDQLAHYQELNARLLNLFHTIFHNLKTHTGNISSLVDLTCIEADPVEQSAQLLLLKKVSEDLTRTLADLARIVTCDHVMIKEPVFLKDSIDRAELTVNGYVQDQKAIFVNNVPTGVSVPFNPAYMDSVLLNFCTNAIRYSHPDRFPAIVFDHRIEDSRNVLYIRDNGVGIDLEKHGRSLFGWSQTFHGHHHALGFGLYLTKYQIESMEASISVQSQVGMGTTFRIVFSE